MGDFTSVGENLVRHKAGTIYLRAKVKGKVIRISLETSDLRIAKLKRDDRLATIPTVAAWLGHKDGGALLLRTYNHSRDSHSLRSARKL